MDPAALLPELEAPVESDLLPTNTRIFASSVRYGRCWHLSLWSGSLAFAVFLFLGVGLHHSAQAACLVIAFIILWVDACAGAAPVSWCHPSPRRGTVVAYLTVTANVKTKQYKRQTAQAEWHEGVIVFPSGDVVVRFNNVFRTIDVTIEAVYLSRADVETAWSFPWCCRRRKFLKVYFLGIDARPEMLRICEDDLRDSVNTVCAYIADVKSRNLASDF